MPSATPLLVGPNLSRPRRRNESRSARKSARRNRLRAMLQLRQEVRCSRGGEGAFSRHGLADPAVLLPLILIGFAAQLVDGALGMAFGQISSTLLIASACRPLPRPASIPPRPSPPPSRRSAMSPTATSTGAVLPARHPGVIGGVLGAYVLTDRRRPTRPSRSSHLSDRARPLPLLPRHHAPPHRARPRIVEPLGLVGGFLDAAGGGGWGAIVTSNLLVQGSNPRKTIGTVNTAEFFLTVTISATFIARSAGKAFTMRPRPADRRRAAPRRSAPWIAKRVNPDTLLTFVGALSPSSAATASTARSASAQTAPIALRDRGGRLHHRADPRRRLDRLGL
jgi:uncharacterized membrane protein YfcA